MDLERLRLDVQPELDEWRLWISATGADLAKRYHEDALTRVRAGDSRWNEHLEVAELILRKRNISF
jgi:hypothetical protein